MMQLRRSAERGRFGLDWLQSAHTFSFGSYFDPNHMGFRSLRVINEDTVQPGGGFPPHGHRDMEIISYVTAGALEHEDSMRHGSVVHAGDVQYMRAGKGVRHSEYNASDDEVLKFLQIWIVPNRRGAEPAYDQRTLQDGERNNRFCLIASGDPQDGGIVIQQDARLLTSKLEAGSTLSYDLGPQRGAWVQLVQGNIELNGAKLTSGDGVALEAVEQMSFKANEASEVLLFDLGWWPER